MTEPRLQVRTERFHRADLPTDRPAPHSLEAERAVLSACLRSQEAMGEAAGLLTAADFHAPRHVAVFDACAAIAGRGEPVDAVGVAVELEKDGRLAEYGGPSFLDELLDVGSSPANVIYHAKVVKERSRLRELIRISHDVGREAYDGGTAADSLLDEAQQKLFDLSQKSEANAFQPLESLATKTFEQIQKAFHNPEKITGVRTGFSDIDDKTGGLQRSDLIIVAGRPAMGKTSFALNIAYNAASAFQAPVGVFSLEMSAEQLCMRLISSEGRLNNHDVRTGKLQPTDWPRLTQALSNLSRTPLFIDDTSSISLLELRSKARRMVQHHGVKMIVIDYMQLINAGSRIENRQQEISMISRSLKGMAKDLDVPVVALSQLSRAVESRADPRPMLSDLRESGAIEQDADIVMFVFREEYYDKTNPDVQNIAEIIIGKHRNGAVGTVKLYFDKTFTKFTNLAKDHPAITGREM